MLLLSCYAIQRLYKQLSPVVRSVFFDVVYFINGSNLA